MYQRDDIEPKYEFVYRSVAASIEEFIAGSPHDSPPVIYARLKPFVAAVWAAALWAVGKDKMPPPAEQEAFCLAYLNERVTWLELSQAKSGTRVEYIASTDALTVSLLKPHLAHCDTILELGCGWGHRLIDLHLAGIKARYFGGDRSENSRKAAFAASGLFEDMDLSWFRFDFLKPDYSDVPIGGRDVCLLTCHAIEQVGVVGRDFIDEALNRFQGSRLCGVHIEPLASQLDPARATDVRYAHRHGYNTDLFEVVRSHERLEIVASEPLMYERGHGNATSLLAWRSKT
jgi:hypothetical protein